MGYAVAILRAFRGHVRRGGSHEESRLLPASTKHSHEAFKGRPVLPRERQPLATASPPPTEAASPRIPEAPGL